MYPADLLNLFPPFARTNRVFVAMSFDERFRPLWDAVIKPAVEKVLVDGIALEAHRVDLTRKSDSVITEIVQEIAQSRLILADVSIVGWLEGEVGRPRAIRNANVMYELGIAHAARLPEEVVVVRGDADPLDFDIAGVRVHQYSEEPNAARDRIAELLTDALKSVDQRRSVAVRQALKSLDPVMYLILQEFGDIPHPSPRTLGQILGSLDRQSAIQRLLAGGMLEARFGPLPDDFMARPAAELARYRKTPFGAAVFGAARHEMDFADAIGRWVATEAGKKWLADQSIAAAADVSKAT
jgi:hypothetical protein